MSRFAAIVGSVFPAQRAYQALRRRSLDINALMVIAVAGAVAIGEYEEAAMMDQMKQLERKEREAKEREAARL